MTPATSGAAPKKPSQPPPDRIAAAPSEGTGVPAMTCTTPQAPTSRATQPIALRPAGALCSGCRRIRQAAATSSRGASHASVPIRPTTMESTTEVTGPSRCHQTAEAARSAAPMASRPTPSGAGPGPGRGRLGRAGVRAHRSRERRPATAHAGPVPGRAPAPRMVQVRACGPPPCSRRRCGASAWAWSVRARSMPHAHAWTAKRSDDPGKTPRSGRPTTCAGGPGRRGAAGHPRRLSPRPTHPRISAVTLLPPSQPAAPRRGSGAPRVRPRRPPG